MKFINIEHIKVFSISKVKKIMANNNQSHSKRIMNILKHAVFITIFNFRKNLGEWIRINSFYKAIERKFNIWKNWLCYNQKKSKNLGEWFEAKNKNKGITLNISRNRHILQKVMQNHQKACQKRVQWSHSSKSKKKKKNKKTNKKKRTNRKDIKDYHFLNIKNMKNTNQKGWIKRNFTNIDLFYFCFWILSCISCLFKMILLFVNIRSDW